MEPSVILAGKVIEFLLPYVGKGAEKLAQNVSSDLYDKSKLLLKKLKDKFHGDKEATDVLEHFEEKPERYQLALEDILNEKLEQDRDLANELDRFLKDAGPLVMSIQKIKDAESVVGIETDEMTEGKAMTIQDIEKGKDVIGSKIKRIGR